MWGRIKVELSYFFMMLFEAPVLVMPSDIKVYERERESFVYIYIYIHKTKAQNYGTFICT